MQYMWHTLYTLHWDLLWEEYTKNIRGNISTYSFCIFTNWHPPPQDLGLVGCDSWNTWVCMFRGYNSKCKTQLSWILLTAIHILCMITHGSFVWEVGLLVLMVFAWLHNLHIYIYFVFQALVLTATVSSNKTQITSSYCTCITEITNCNYLFPFETKSITRV